MAKCLDSKLLPPEQNLLPKCTQTIRVKNTTVTYNGLLRCDPSKIASFYFRISANNLNM